MLTRRELLATGSLAAISGAALSPGLTAAAEPKPFREWTDKSLKSTQRGTRWLMKTMHSNGACGVDIGQPPDIGCTAMVGLALLSQGNTPVEGPYGSQLRRVISYLLSCTETMPNDDITSAVRTQLQNKIGRHAHSFFATLFLSQVMGQMSDSTAVRRGLKKVISAVSRSQTADGSWGGQSWAPVLGTVMGWLSLKAAHLAGMNVGASADKVADHLVKQMESQIGKNRGWMHNLYKHAAGIRVLYSMGREDDPISKKAFEGVVQVVSKDNTPFSQAGGEEYLAFHLITETMLQRGGDHWTKWFPTVRDKIVGVQNADGSWAGAHCITSRTFCTAAAILVLSAPNRYLPISQP